jgi:threonine dehydrogenase-like Zn-dependent dehydrogenase
LPDDGDVWRFCKERWRHGPQDRGADFVFQCRGQAASLHTALKSVRPHGTVIDLAFYQGGADVIRLGEEFHHNGLTIRCAQIARVPRGLTFSWDRARLAQETIELLRVYGDLIKHHLITDIVPIDHAPKVIAELAARERDSLQVVFRFD